MSSLKVKVEAKVTPTAKVEKPIPVLANSIPIGGAAGQVLTKKSGFDIITKLSLRKRQRSSLKIEQQ